MNTTYKMRGNRRGQTKRGNNSNRHFKKNIDKTNSDKPSSFDDVANYGRQREPSIDRSADFNGRPNYGRQRRPSMDRPAGFNDGANYGRQHDLSMNRPAGFNDGAAYGRQYDPAGFNDRANYGRQHDLSMNRPAGFNDGAAYGRQHGPFLDGPTGFNDGANYGRQHDLSMNRPAGFNDGAAYGRQHEFIDRPTGFTDGAAYGRQHGPFVDRPAGFNDGASYGRQHGPFVDRPAGFNDSAAYGRQPKSNKKEYEQPETTLLNDLRQKRSNYRNSALSKSTTDLTACKSSGERMRKHSEFRNRNDRKESVSGNKVKMQRNRVKNKGKKSSDTDDSSSSKDSEEEDMKAFLYATITQDVAITPQLFEALHKRLKNKIPFKTTSVKKNEKTRYIDLCLEFQSKNQLKKAVHLINASNEGSDMNIECKQESGLKEKVIQEKKPTRDEMDMKSEKILNKHRKKLKDKCKDCKEDNIDAQFRVQKIHLETIESFKAQENEHLLQEHEYLSVFKKLSLEKKSSANKEETMKIDEAFKIECNRLSKALPIYSKRTEIIKTIKKKQVTILFGEAGSGKTTQLVQYLIEEDSLSDGKIMCTQPIEKAVKVISECVASELDTSLVHDDENHEFSIKNDSKEIVFLSERNMLSNFNKDNKNLSDYSCIIIDEAQERSVYTELLLGLIKKALPKNPKFRLVITLANTSPEKFRAFFPKCGLLEISRCVFPVHLFWESVHEDKGYENDYEEMALKKTIAVHQSEKINGDILVFLATPAETERCCKLFRAILPKETNYICFSLHSHTALSDQQKILFLPQSGKRKIVFATDCAERAITVPNIKYVIDTGKEKEKIFESNNKKDTMSVRFISRSSARQRQRRAGYDSIGKCYRLYTQKDYKNMQVSSLPEISHDHLDKAILNLIEMEVEPSDFDFLDEPSSQNLSDAIDNLIKLGAVLKTKTITPLGKKLTTLPFKPWIGWLVFEGIKRTIVFESIVFACFSGFDYDIFLHPNSSKNEEFQKSIENFDSQFGEVFTLVSVFKEWSDQAESQRNKWCKDKGITGTTLKLIENQMKDVLLSLNIDLSLMSQYAFDLEPLVLLKKRVPGMICPNW